jgi:hypothetical protein
MGCPRTLRNRHRKITDCTSDVLTAESEWSIDMRYAFFYIVQGYASVPRKALLKDYLKIGFLQVMARIHEIKKVDSPEFRRSRRSRCQTSASNTSTSRRR